MSLALGAIADDYTGASDLANTLAKEGLRTVQTIGIPAAGLDLPEVDAVVVSLKIRSVAAAQAVERARAADQWLRARGAAHVMYKICSTFDSTDAGNIGPVLDALRHDVDEKSVLVTPAFPETGRTVYQGNLFVGAVPLNESPLKDHPLNPMRDANLVRVLARQSMAAVGSVDLATVARGADAIRARNAALSQDGAGAAIADAVFESDLEAIGAAALAQRLSVGASGLGLGLARGLVAAGTARRHQRTVLRDRPVGGPAACLAGSCSRATLTQIARAEETMPVLRLDPERLMSGVAETHRALAWAAARLADGPVLIASSGSPEVVSALQARHGRDAAGHAIEQSLATIAEGLVELGVRRLVVAGGETSGAVVDQLAIPAFELGPEIAAGVPALRALGSPHGELLLALKSGNFGGDRFFADALAVLA
ncbi:MULTISPECIES: 3-oxo-tetronate kinase [unclassified Mesorhizobium]|uniref:3-oxo-tetronate kinase n=3 Tax=Mesorhizobium TaxID=68287 RepID=UPI000FCA77E6|nr:MULTISPECIES: 3-oxo-tetronate kinase [unclassified Mesorhizobium]RUV45863.1 four-carbon acid sugar kinase family protein [Mesorhizobium sp. M1A.T.Ca.IN.004.03.1.1]RWI94429.1 MAG: four-carbon acid sugar kinase family protein [Mesorhizobium sp.]RWK36030.1 MAG: four-carbon acid sugar kinase family protein [Mesorhizobium sp.]TIP20688.1 MAG: four-carbon acid sugar kinase family protein [Mesorhizobium sp.]TJV85065.1 MAG: four-carbon acid sugar kinase family protein [Mesorhizobium sp.]